MIISREQVADLHEGDVVELLGYVGWPGVSLRGPLALRGGELHLGPLTVRTSDGRCILASTFTLTVVSRAPRPLYVNHPRTEPVPGDVVRDADDDDDARTWMYRSARGLNYIRTVPHYGSSGPGVLIDAHERREHLPARLRLLVDGTTGQVVPS